MHKTSSRDKGANGQREREREARTDRERHRQTDGQTYGQTVYSSSLDFASVRLSSLHFRPPSAVVSHLKGLKLSIL